MWKSIFLLSYISTLAREEKLNKLSEILRTFDCSKIKRRHENESAQAYGVRYIDTAEEADVVVHDHSDLHVLTRLFDAFCWKVYRNRFEEFIRLEGLSN